MIVSSFDPLSSVSAKISKERRKIKISYGSTTVLEIPLDSAALHYDSLPSSIQLLLICYRQICQRQAFSRIFGEHALVKIVNKMEKILIALANWIEDLNLI